MNFLNLNSMKNSIKPFELRAEPLPGCFIDSEAPSPEVPIMLKDIGVKEIVNMIVLDIEPYHHKVNVVISESLIGKLNYSQLYYIQCNMMWLLREYVGFSIDFGLKQRIINNIEDLIYYMMSVEISPGDFGQEIIESGGLFGGIIFNMKITAEDFGLLEDESIYAKVFKSVKEQIESWYTFVPEVIFISENQWKEIIDGYSTWI